MAKCFYFRQTMASSDESSLQVANCIENSKIGTASNEEQLASNNSAAAAFTIAKSKEDANGSTTANGNSLNLSLSDAILDADYFLVSHILKMLLH